MGGDARLRLFLALRLPEQALDELEGWQRAHLRGVRVVPREQLHITLAFLGARPADELDAVVAALRTCAGRASPEVRLEPVRYRETRSVAMLVLDDREGRAGAFADDLQASLERLGVYRREGRRWLPHLTVARFRERPALGLEPPRGRTLVPSDAAVYLSRLGPGGAQYEVLESVALGAGVGGQ